MARKAIAGARNVVGPNASRLRRWSALLSLIVIVVAGLVAVRTVLAVNSTGKFELDGNAADDPAVQGDDWDDVFAGTDTANVSSFTSDGALNATIFAGNNKDIQDVSAWSWKDDTGGLPDKDNLLNSYAARYSVLPADPVTCPNGTDPFDPTVPCVVLFFGADRYDGSGDAHMAFWFFKNRIARTNTKSGGGFLFSGVHALGDLLILSDFSNGGTVPTINVFEWDPACLGANKPTADCADKNLRRLANPGQAGCLSSGASDPFCAIVNAADVPVPWPFVDKAGNNGVIPPGEFYEGGLNLSTLGLADQCFSSVSAETRSSTSTDATLKDFVLGDFASCTASLTTTPSAGAGGAVAPGISVTDIATVHVEGIANPPTPTGNVTFFICGPIATGTCDGTTNVGTQLGSPVPLVDASTPPDTTGNAPATSAAVNTAAAPLSPGRYCFRAEWPGDVNYPPAPGTTKYVHSGTGDSECFNVTVVPTVTTSAQTWLPNDSGTVTAATAGTLLNGTLSFTLYEGGTCSGTILRAAETFTLTNAASPQTRNTTNSTVSVTTSKTVSWRVVWDSTDAGVADSSHCEVTQLVITN